MGDGKEVKSGQQVHTPELLVPPNPISTEGAKQQPVKPVKLDFEKKGMGSGNADTYGADTPPAEPPKFGITLNPKPVTPKPVVTPKPPTVPGSVTPSLFTAGPTPYIRPDVAHPEPGFQIAEKISDEQLLAWAKDNPLAQPVESKPNPDADPYALALSITRPELALGTPVLNVPNTDPVSTGDQEFSLVVPSLLSNGDGVNDEIVALFKSKVNKADDPKLKQFSADYSQGMSTVIAAGNGDRESTVNNVVEYQNRSFAAAVDLKDKNSLINHYLKLAAESGDPALNNLSEKASLALGYRLVRDEYDEQYVKQLNASIEDGDNEAVVALTKGAAHDGVVGDNKTRVDVEVRGLDAVAEEDREEVADHIIENDHHEIDESDEEMQALHERQVQQFVSYASATRLALFIARNADHSELIERASNRALANEKDPEKREALKAKIDNAVKTAKTDEVKAQVKRESAKPAAEKPAGEGLMTGRAPAAEAKPSSNPDVPFGEGGEQPVLSPEEKLNAQIAERRRQAEELLARQQAASTPESVRPAFQGSPQLAAKKLQATLIDPDSTYVQREQVVNELIQKDTFYRVNVYIQSRDPETRKFLIENNVISMGEIAEYFEKFPQELRVARQDIQDEVHSFNEQNNPDQKTQETAEAG